jgi:urease subunit gamma/beta
MFVRPVRLSPADKDKLLLATAGMVARDRRNRGVKLNHPEAVALLSCWVIEAARDGDRSVKDLMNDGLGVLGRDDVMDGVAALASEVMVEATFPDGRKLVTLHDPITASPSRAGDGEQGEETREQGDETPAMMPAVEPMIPGEVRTTGGDVELNAGRRKLQVKAMNVGDRPVQVGSHFHAADVNRAVRFTPKAPKGYRFDIPAGTSLRFEPGRGHDVQLVALEGARQVPGLQIRRPRPR